MDTSDVDDSQNAPPGDDIPVSRTVHINAHAAKATEGGAIYAEHIHNYGRTKAQSDSSGEYQLYPLNAESLPIPGSGPLPDITSARENLQHHRALCMLHDDSRAGDCARTRITLLKAVAKSGRTLLTAPTLDLRRHLAYRDDLESHKPFVLYFEESHLERVDSNIRLLISHSEWSRLLECLKELDGFIVIPVSAQVRRRPDFKAFDWSGLHVMQFESTAVAAKVEEPDAASERWDEHDPLANTIRFVAAFLPELQMTQFDGLMARLLEAAQPAADAAAEASRTPKRFQVQARTMNLAARWKAAADQAVRDAGVVYGKSKFGGSGYHFADADQALSVATMLLEHRPAWLGRQFDVVMTWLLEDPSWSPAKQQGAQRLWVSLHDHGIVAVDSDRLWRLFEEHVLREDASPAAFGCLRTVLAHLLTVPSTSDVAFEFLRLLVAQCPAAASAWFEWIESQPETMLYLSSGAEAAAEALRRRLDEAASQHTAIRQLATLQHMLVAALDRVELDRLLPVLVDATAEHERLRSLSQRFAADPALRFLTEPARWCMWSALGDWLTRSAHLLPEFCIETARYWRQLDMEGTSLEERWRTTVLFDAVLRALYGLVDAYVFKSDADAQRAVAVIFDDRQAEAFDRALGLAIATLSGRLRGDEGKAERYAPPFDLPAAINLYGLMVCALQKRDPARSTATRARVRSLAKALRGALDPRLRAGLSNHLRALEESFRRQKDVPALSQDQARRRIWLSRIDAVRELRCA